MSQQRHNIEMLKRIVEDLDRVSRYGMDLSPMFLEAKEAAQMIGRAPSTLRRMQTLEQYRPWTTPIVEKGVALYAPWRIEEFVELLKEKPMPDGPIAWERPHGFIPGMDLEAWRESS